MKLYTEEHVHKALELLLETGKHNDLIIESLTPIELPTEEEIEKAARDENIYNNLHFRLGAKWVLQHITSQVNK